MIRGKKLVVVMPAYNAARTIEKTWREVIAQEIVDLVIVVDDASHDATLSLARSLDKVMTQAHPRNRGYGANQKTCYRLALDQGADIVVMVHPDYQYSPPGKVGARAFIAVSPEGLVRVQDDHFTDETQARTGPLRWPEHPGRQHHSCARMATPFRCPIPPTLVEVDSGAPLWLYTGQHSLM